MKESVLLRPALEKDESLLFQVYFSTREAELALTDWDQQQKHAFVLHQFTAQNQHYQTRYPGAELQVIEFKGEAVGRLYTHEFPDRIHIMDITLLPGARKQGIGRFLLEQLQSRAQQQNKRVTIYVENYNPAKRLYERLGFTRKASEGEVYDFMEWNPETKDE
ncbi:MAG: GCN5-related N-acetyltransferase [Verrucomicrobiales bacterium]|nr:GCN5-related N-acetyltransferase [Verrucomicrobiales bacterium]